MATLVELLGQVATGVPSNAVWTAIQAAWARATRRSWEDLYLDAFAAALHDLAPQFARYARDGGELEVDRAALVRALNQQVGAAGATRSLTQLPAEQDLAVLAEALAAQQVLCIGGHALSADDYEQLTRNLVRHASAVFRQSVVDNEDAFRRAVLDEASVQGDTARDTLRYLRSAFGSTLSGLDDLAAELRRQGLIVGEIASDVQDIRAGVQQVTGLFETLARASPTLSVHLRTGHFRTLIEERTRGFVGREYVFEAIAAQLRAREFSSGYIVIRGEPGIGKTALIARLVQQRGCIHHFNIALQGIRSTADFLGSVCAQLIVAFHLPHDALPAHATRDSGFLVQLLHEAAAAGGPVLVAVDALDEAEEAPSPVANTLLLPAALPVGVFFVLSMRNRYEVTLTVDQRRDFYLDENDPQHRDDVRRYIAQELDQDQEEMAAVLREWGANEDDFIATLTEKSEGNFMYLVHVLRDVRARKLTAATLGDLSRLPQGLRDYYQRHWAAMRAVDPDRFARAYEPVVCLLGAVREPVTIEQLTAWVNVDAGPHDRLTAQDVQHVVRDWWEFLNVVPGDSGTTRVAIYHSSFQDFLNEEVGLTRSHARITRFIEKLTGW